MAKLIVTRPRAGRFENKRQIYRILIDGEGDASIPSGEKVEVDLPPGHHQITARFGFFASQPVKIEAGPDTVHYLGVGYNSWFRRLLWLLALLAAVLQFGIPLFLVFSINEPRFGSAQSAWLIGFLVASSALVFTSALAVSLSPFVWRSRFLSLVEVPNCDSTDQQITELLKARPLRLRMTIRQMMIAVAILAIVLWAGVETTRNSHRSSFQLQGRVHANSEAIFRKTEQGWIDVETETEKRGLGRGHFSKEAAKAAAMADYHAAMRRKYELAAARRWFSVEPDPPPPPWP